MFLGNRPQLTSLGVLRAGISGSNEFRKQSNLEN